MPYAIDLLKTLDLVGGSAEYDYDVGVHSASRTVYVALSVGGNDGTFTGGGNETVVGHGSRTRIVVFDNQRFVVFWLDNASALRARGFAFSGSALIEGATKTVATAIASFDVASVGVTTGVQHGGSGVAVYYNYRQFAFTMLSENGSWKLGFGAVTDSAEVSIDQVAPGGTGDKVTLSCASLNETLHGAHPRKAFTLWRDAGQIKTQSWRVAYADVTPLATTAETKPLGVGAVYGMSLAPGADIFATLVWPGASNATARLQLVSLAADGAMSTYASDEIVETPTTFAPLHSDGGDAAVAYTTPLGQLAVAAWRFAAPGGSGPARTVLASKVSGEQPTQVRLTSLMPDDDNTSTVPLVTLHGDAGGALRLVSWRLRKTLDYLPAGPSPIGTVNKP
jgi:hypothetical protein